MGPWGPKNGPWAPKMSPLRTLAHGPKKIGPKLGPLGPEVGPLGPELGPLGPKKWAQKRGTKVFFFLLENLGFPVPFSRHSLHRLGEFW